MARGSPKTYRFRVTFNAPLPFVFRWCTDYQPSDPRLEGESFRRRVLKRTARTVVYEDLEEASGGWAWRRHVVSLRPPNRWHSDSVGNYRDFVLDYELRELRGGGTELRFVGRRRPAVLGGPNPSSREFGRSMDATWKRFRRQLESDYRRSARLTERRRPPRRSN